MRIPREDVLFVMVDIQEKFRNHIYKMEQVVQNANILNRSAELLKIPLLITEQYPKGLGGTMKEIYQPAEALKMEKTLFSIFDTPIENFIKTQAKKYLVIYGIETHICIMQTVLDSIHHNLMPIIVEDAVSSISKYNKEIAIRRFNRENAVVVSTEMLLFELLRDAKHPQFREISNLVKHKGEVTSP